jgi:hypothetical protein
VQGWKPLNELQTPGAGRSTRPFSHEMRESKENGCCLFGTWRSLERTAGGRGGSPGPLEIETAEVPSDVDDFADEEKAWDGA